MGGLPAPRWGGSGRMGGWHESRAIRDRDRGSSQKQDPGPYSSIGGQGPSGQLTPCFRPRFFLHLDAVQVPQSTR
jgi:hypothetical protein